MCVTGQALIEAPDKSRQLIASKTTEIYLFWG